MFAPSADHVPHPPAELRSHFRRRSHSATLLADDMNKLSPSSAPRRNSSNHMNANSISNSRSGDASRGSKCGSEAWNGHVRSIHVKENHDVKREWSRDAQAVIMSAFSIVAAASQLASTDDSRTQHRTVMSSSFDSDNNYDNDVVMSTTTWNEPGNSSSNRRSVDSCESQHSSMGMRRVFTVHSFDLLGETLASTKDKWCRNGELVDMVTRNHTINTTYNTHRVGPNDRRSPGSSNVEKSNPNNQPRSSLSKNNLSTLAELHIADPANCSKDIEQNNTHYYNQSPQSPRNSSVSRDSALPRILV